MNSNEIFAKNLQKYMEMNDVSRQDLSQALGISYFTITSWVNGSKYPRIDKIEKLAAYFNIQKSKLIEENYKEGKTDTDIKEEKEGLPEEAQKIIDILPKLDIPELEYLLKRAEMFEKDDAP